MEISYLILAHHNFEHLQNMIDALDHPNVKFFIHIDKKVELSLIKKFRFYHMQNCKLIKNRYCVNWGGYNMIRATLRLIKAAYIPKNKGYYVLMSGDDYPMRDTNYIFDFLSDNYGKEFIYYNSMPYSNWSVDGGMDRIDYYWFIDTIGFNHSAELCKFQKSINMKRPFFEDFKPYGGSQWWCLTSECVNYILKFLRANDIYQSYFESSFVPDEIFFNSIVGNSPFSSAVTGSNLKYIEWNSEEPHPKILVQSDYPNIISSDNLWIRKVNRRVSLELINEIDRYIGKK